MGTVTRSLLAGILISLISLIAYYVYSGLYPTSSASQKTGNYWGIVIGMSLTTAVIGAGAAFLFEKTGGVARVCKDAGHL